MIKSITNFLIIFFIFQQLKSQISQIDQNGYNAFCDETLHIFLLTLIWYKNKLGYGLFTLSSSPSSSSSSSSSSSIGGGGGKARMLEGGRDSLKIPV